MVSTEKRLIDANAALKKMQNWNTKERLINCVEDAPTVDAVEVVRCEKCQYWNKRYETKGICLKHNSIVTFTSPDFYCVCGERKNDGKSTSA